ncbi:uncharacterized protein STEHIDRAFT_154810 [Stereum hirsutum FP-91666 SS1]|uniref:uncharacterized protein n=1 Tax=Stereum hirsutum (strain FP-91666) TaxID=721885 RepID=UPI000440E64F|nr:uncharacterized protein STEHIDRAFT_154810 [Stereum hirsutum FP-91666 SS1]EIM89126.1 hypothetical protein STEHIDRAFT_154810 [Stereum hirsutum FP-91666 SS1]
MITEEEKATLRLLVQHVSRAFYEPKFIVVMDQLARHEVLKDDDLAGRMGLQLKELNKIMAVLENDGLIQVQNELKEGAQRSVGRQYFYLDYQHFCNVVKWRVAHMRRTIEHGLRNELDNKGYVCPQCGKSYSTLEVDKLMDFALGAFVCEICSGELIDNENAESVRGSQDRMQRFNWQMRYIVEGLRKTEPMVLPAFDVIQFIHKNFTSADASQNASNEPGSGLKVAGSSGSSRKDDGVGIVLSTDKDEDTVRKERDAEAAAKRQQNAMPSWHMQSTITGDLTALGIKERQRIEGLSNGNPIILGPDGYDESLKGLGKVGSTGGTTNGLNGGMQMNGGDGINLKVEDAKPDLDSNPEADYYDQYYASLAASAAPSASQTPSIFPIDDFEEDKKPNVDYLDYMNEFKKRSRSSEDVGGDGRKVARVDVPLLNGANGINGHGAVSNGYPYTNGVSGEESMAPTPAAGGAEDDPLVYVNGEPVPFSAVTEEHQELMTPEEYTTYFEVFQARS